MYWFTIGILELLLVFFVIITGETDCQQKKRNKNLKPFEKCSFNIILKAQFKNNANQVDTLQSLAYPPPTHLGQIYCRVTTVQYCSRHNASHVLYVDWGSMHVVEHHDALFSWKKYNNYTLILKCSSKTAHTLPFPCSRSLTSTWLDTGRVRFGHRFHQI